jgi:putative transposase
LFQPFQKTIKQNCQKKFVSKQMEKTQQGTKKFTKEEKLGILAEAERNGVVVTLAKYELSPATYYYWKRKLTFGGVDALKHSKHRQLESEHKLLAMENERLKILLAEKELESRLKDELLRKMYPNLKKNI